MATVMARLVAQSEIGAVSSGTPVRLRMIVDQAAALASA